MIPKTAINSLVKQDWISADATICRIPICRLLKHNAAHIINSTPQSFSTRRMSSSVFLTQVYLKHIFELRAFLLRRVGCREIAAELAQETFLRMMNYQHTEALHNIRALLYQIAGNLAVDYHCMQVRQPVHTTIHELSPHDIPVSDASDPARIVFARQILEQLCHVIEELPPQCHRAFVLHKFDGLSHADIASQLGITRNAVEKLLIRALVRLRRVLA